MTLPQHIAFICDGNGRWATKRFLPRNAGHKEGAKAIQRTIEALCEKHIPYASFFVFSTQNWKRSKEEVDGLMELAKQYFSSASEFFASHNIQVSFWGDKSVFPKQVQEILVKVEKETQNFTSLHVAFCLNYGGREDIVQAVNKLISSGKKSVSEDDIKQNLFSRDFPDPDFVVRTSGEERVSNFLLFQMAYAELYFPKCYWPDYDKIELEKALKVFSKRKRRFGGNQ